MRRRTLFVAWAVIAIATVTAHFALPVGTLRSALPTLYPISTLLLIAISELPRQSRILQQIYAVDRDLWMRLTHVPMVGPGGVNSLAMLAWLRQPIASIPDGLKASWIELKSSCFVGPLWFVTTLVAIVVFNIQGDA